MMEVVKIKLVPSTESFYPNWNSFGGSGKLSRDWHDMRVWTKFEGVRSLSWLIRTWRVIVDPHSIKSFCTSCPSWSGREPSMMFMVHFLSLIQANRISRTMVVVDVLRLPDSPIRWRIRTSREIEIIQRPWTHSRHRNPFKTCIETRHGTLRRARTLPRILTSAPRWGGAWSRSSFSKEPSLLVLCSYWNVHCLPKYYSAPKVGSGRWQMFSVPVTQE